MDISPSSDVVEKKTGYLGLAPVSVLSRKLSFMMIGEVFRAENSITRKNPNPETFGTYSLESLLSRTSDLSATLLYSVPTNFQLLTPSTRI